ncbi:MAG: PspA/IM30 family protein [Bacteroidota bacterium]
MWQFIKRTFTFGKSKANEQLDKIEDPIKVTEQNIAELKKNLAEGLRGLAEVRAMSIRIKRDKERSRKVAANYEKKAILLLKKAQQGEMSEAKADELAKRALQQKEMIARQSKSSEQEMQKYEKLVQEMENRVQQIKAQVYKYENELRTLKARSEMSRMTQKLNKTLSRFDSEGMNSVLDQIKDQVAEQEALSDSYGDFTLEKNDLDDEIDELLGGSTDLDDSLADLKQKLLLEEEKEEEEEQKQVYQAPNGPPNLPRRKKPRPSKKFEIHEEDESESAAELERLKAKLIIRKDDDESDS